MAEPAVVNEGVLLVAYDEWSAAVAALVAHALGARGAAVPDGHERAVPTLAQAARLASCAVLVAAGPASSDARDALRAALEQRLVPHLGVQREGDSVWVGPAVVPPAPGCHACWEARRRQHAERLDAPAVAASTAAPATAPRAMAAALPSSGDAESERLAARATLAVLRRVLAAPASEAGVVRRFAADAAVRDSGRVIAVTGCARCDRPLPRPAGWSLRPAATSGAVPPSTRKEVRT